MRVLLLNPNTSESVTAQVAAHVRRIAPALDLVPVTARFGARYIASRAGLAVAAHAALDALAEHGQGCDAVYLACFGDPGLAALREVSPAPVIGLVEASCREATERPGRFAIVTGGALWGPILAEMVAALGLTERFAGVRTVEATGAEIARDPEAAMAGLAAACAACAEEGAATVILGGAALAGLAERVRSPVPVICSVEAGARAVVAARPAGRAPGRPAVETVGLSAGLARILAGR